MTTFRTARFLVALAACSGIAAGAAAEAPLRTPIGDVSHIDVYSEARDPANADCDELQLARAEVADFLQHAVVLSERQQQDWFESGACRARGRLLTRFGRWQWEMRHHGTATVTTSDGQVFVLGDPRIAAPRGEGGKGAIADDALVEAVVLFKVQRLSADGAGFCLFIAGADPTPARLARLRATLPKLQPGSDCNDVPEAGSERHHEIRDRDGHPATVLYLRLQEPPDDAADADAATVEYAWDSGDWSGHGGAVQAVRRDGAWVVSQANRYEWVE